jgi:DNA-binding MarR family transcriptional regulator
MDLEDWRVHAIRAWEISGIFAKKLEQLKQQELEQRKQQERAQKANSGLSEASLEVFEAIYSGLTRCREIAKETGVSNGQTSKIASHLIRRGLIRKNGRQYQIVEKTN